jgi:2-polyprenyl-3-methyl-5-hydroxy-6-metoxy-1,4-benzoquinol methylase
MNYPGKELEIFDKAVFWRKYIYILVKKYLKDDLLEVGAGIGSFSNNYKNKINNITLTELDKENIKQLKKKFKRTKIKIKSKYTSKINKKFNSILYMNVLEHIKNDKKEINTSLSKLNKNGYLVILVPAHNELYTKFDKEIGHFRRYKINFFKKLKLKNSTIIKLHYLDCLGYFLYYLNKIFFKNEIYPSKVKIFIWDKFFTPITFFLDKFLNYKFGKNVLCIIKKN